MDHAPNWAHLSLWCSTVNQPPNIASQNYSIDENSANGTFVCHVIASDPDDGQSISYSILGGILQMHFRLIVQMEILL